MASIPSSGELDWTGMHRSCAWYVPRDDPKIVVDANLQLVLEQITIVVGRRG